MSSFPSGRGGYRTANAALTDVLA
eukprot:gene12618-biopygen3347